MKVFHYTAAAVIVAMVLTGCSEPTPSGSGSGDANASGSAGTSGTTADSGSTGDAGTADRGTGAPAAAGAPTAPPTQLSDDADARAAVASREKLKNIMIGMHNHHDVFRCLPASYNMDAEGKPLLSWRVLLLPFVGEKQLFDQFRLDEPWDSPHNKNLIAQIPDIYRCTRGTLEEGKTTYLTVRGADTAFPPPADTERGKGQQTKGVGFVDLRDGTSNTIAVVDVTDAQAVIWTAPQDFEVNTADPSRGLLGTYKHGYPVSYCDSSVEFLTPATSADLLRGLFTRAGGEVLDR